MFAVNNNSSAKKREQEQDEAASKIQQHWRNRKTGLDKVPFVSHKTTDKKKKQIVKSKSFIKRLARKVESIRYRNFLPQQNHPSCVRHYKKLQLHMDEDPSQLQRFRAALYLIMEEPSSSLAAEVMSLMVLGTVILSIICFCLETIPELVVDVNVWLAVEIFCSVSFSLEYIVRFWVCIADGTRRSQFVLGAMNMLDLAAILPFYVQMAFVLANAPQTGALRIFRVFRIFRILKLSRYSKGMQMMGEAVMSSMHILLMLFFVLVIGVIIFASMVYFLEKLSCPQMATMSTNDHIVYNAECADSLNGGKSPSFGLCCDEWESPWGYPSVPAGFWWSIVTMTTVGFGDMYPITWQGRFVGIFAMLVGILLIALPTAIVGRKFQEVYEREEAVEEAKSQGRMSVISLASIVEAPKPVVFDAGERLRSLKLKDSRLAGAIKDLASLFEETDPFYHKLQSSCIEQHKSDEKINISFGRFVQHLDDDLYSRKAMKQSGSPKSSAARSGSQPVAMDQNFL